jgi:hypothetical protein
MNDDDIQKKSENSFYKALFPDRLNRLIDKILDLEKFETGKQKLYLSKKYFKTITNTLDSVRQLIINKISLSSLLGQNRNKAFYDEENHSSDP